MLKQERHNIILQQLNLHNRVISADLCQKLSVSEDTIRRDLHELAEEGRLIKVHGGAVSKAFHYTLNTDVVYSASEKRTIAQKAASLIKNGMIVLLSGGTTMREVVKALPPNLQATFITPSIPIALELINHPNIEVIFIGAKINKDAQMSVGGEVIRQLKSIRANLCFLGTNAVDAEAGVTDSEWDIVEIKKAMIQASERLAILAISEKLNTIQPFQVCPPEEIDLMVTELDVLHPALRPYREKGITIE